MHCKAVTDSAPHVAILVETSRAYGRDLLRGIRRYITENGPWSVYMELRSLDSQFPAWLKNWSGDGILSRTPSQAMADRIHATGVPVVELRATRLRQDTQQNTLPIGIDNVALGRLVARHFLECKFHNFGIYSITSEDYFAERFTSFTNEIKVAGGDCFVFESPQSREKPLDWEQQQKALGDWVRSLPKPIGIMACTDQLGFWLLDACYRIGVAVPEEVAVIGAENDDTLCSMANPPLSSVRFDGKQMGYKAAALLSRLMNHEPPWPELIRIPPLGIVSRRSSDIVAIDSPDVVESLRFIRENACRGINVEDVLDAVMISRSSLERQMQKLFGRSPKAEIRRVQFNQVKQLLQDTVLTLSDIADRTGFKYSQYLSEAFKREFGITPGEYREERQFSTDGFYRSGKAT